MRLLVRPLFSFVATAATLTVLGLSACTGAADDQASAADPATEESATMVEAPMTRDGLTLTKLTGSPAFADATLKTLNPSADAALKPGNVSFEYAVTNYELGAQTPGAGENGLANSGSGQHIHAILNNEPYMAHYTPGFNKELTAGRYILLSFLSRSYHESIKHAAAADLIQFTVGKTDAPAADLSAPHLFYSRPKGSYSGADAQNLMLDFYLANCNLSADGYTVLATINGTEFTLRDWAPYVITGLPMGDVTIKLELLDNAGNLVSSPFNPVERTVTLQAEAPKP